MPLQLQMFRLKYETVDDEQKDLESFSEEERFHSRFFAS